MGNSDTGLLGDSGENLLDHLCNKVGLRSIDPKPDIEGIDRKIVWVQPGTMALADGESYDKTKPYRRVNVQVKSTQTKDGRVKVKLSAAKHLVDINEPAFILIAKNPASQTPVLSFIHVKEDIIDRILKTLRMCQKKGKLPHKRELSFRVSKGDTVQPNDIRDYLEKQIGEDLDAYAKDKIEYRQECGYSDDRYLMNAVLRADNQASLMDGLMGRTPLQVIQSDHHEKRFGITLPCSSFFSGDKIELTVSPPTLGTWIVTTTAKEEITVRGDVRSNYVDGMPSQLVETEWKSHLCSMSITSKNLNFSLDTDRLFEEAHLPSVMRHSIQFLTNIFDGGNIKVQFIKLNNGFELPGFKITDPDRTFPDEYWLLVLKSIEHIFAKAGIEEYKIKLSDIDANEVISACVLLDPEFSKDINQGYLEISRGFDEQDDLILKSNSVGYVISIAIGKRRVAICSIFEATATLVNDLFEIRTTKLTRYNARALRSGKEESDFESFYDDQTKAFTASFWLKSFKNDFSVSDPHS